MNRLFNIAIILSITASTLITFTPKIKTRTDASLKKAVTPHMSMVRTYSFVKGIAELRTGRRRMLQALREMKKRRAVTMYGQNELALQ